jgi:hypothetical protein
VTRGQRRPLTHRFVTWINFFEGKRRQYVGVRHDRTTSPPTTPTSGQNKPTDRSPERPRLGVLSLGDQSRRVCGTLRRHHAPPAPRTPRTPPRGTAHRWSAGKMAVEAHIMAFPRSALPIVVLGFALVITAAWIGLLGYGVFELAAWAL